MVGKRCSQNHIPTSFASPCTLRCPTSRLTPHLWTPAQQDGVFTLQVFKTTHCSSDVCKRPGRKKQTLCSQAEHLEQPLQEPYGLFYPGD